ncbi:MAG: type II secretion system secretin GspD, partial [Rhodocyclaceae bacterium]|nr:type II secretion system secretin GspD [Rhodocyclaceae bacterium]
AEEQVTLNFANADLESVIKAVGQISGRNFLVDPRVKGQINLISNTPVPASASYDVLLAALRMQGFAAVESNGVTRIVPEAEAKLQGGTVVARKGKAKGDQILTQVFVLRYEAANVALPMIRPLVAPNNSVVASTSSNALVVTDYGENLRRIEKLISEIDQPNAAVPFVIPIHNASALDINQTLNRLFADAVAVNDKMQRISIVPDQRTNSLIVRSDNAAHLERIRELVRQLDKETAVGGNIHIVYLKNAEATKVAQTLRSLLNGDTSLLGNTTSQVSSALSNINSPLGNTSNNNTQQANSGNGVVQADAASNSLIITAPEGVYNNLRAIIDKLDVRRAQVHVEALIVEVTSEKAAEFGIQWQSLNNSLNGGTQVIGGTNFGTRGTGINVLDAAVNPGAVATGLNIGVVKGTVTLPGVGTILNLGMLARALETDANANILSTPNLLTLDNEEAKIVIGQNVPFITGQYAQTGSTVTATPFQTIERKDVGLTLRIKPQISEGGSIRLQIFQEVSSIQEKSNVSGIITNKRSIESTVLIDDRQIVALGGLVQDASTDGNDSVPLLGDIPGIGYLFKYESRKRAKTNLMVFLRPIILRDSASYSELTDQRYQYIIGEQNKQLPKPHPILPDMPAPNLDSPSLKMLPIPPQFLKENPQ